jgi:hypothetical protein
MVPRLNISSLWISHERQRLVIEAQVEVLSLIRGNNYAYLHATEPLFVCISVSFDANTQLPTLAYK